MNILRENKYILTKIISVFLAGRKGKLGNFKVLSQRITKKKKNAS